MTFVTATLITGTLMMALGLGVTALAVRAVRLEEQEGRPPNLGQ